MENIKQELARKLLEIKAIKLSTKEPFTWASGWKSPFYCDNRKTLSYPEIRSLVKQNIAEIAKIHFPQADAIAGVATGAIAQGVLVADILKLPFAYVRSKNKDHGLGNLIEGELPKSANVLVIEDLISTGGSSLKAVDALRSSGFNVVGMIAAFTYGFNVAVEAFKKAAVRLETLTNYDAVLQEALRIDYISQDDIEVINNWRANPSDWKQ